MKPNVLLLILVCVDGNIFLVAKVWLVRNCHFKCTGI